MNCCYSNDFSGDEFEDGELENGYKRLKRTNEEEFQEIVRIIILKYELSIEDEQLFFNDITTPIRDDANFLYHNYSLNSIRIVPILYNQFHNKHIDTVTFVRYALIWGYVSKLWGDKQYEDTTITKFIMKMSLNELHDFDIKYIAIAYVLGRLTQLIEYDGVLRYKNQEELEKYYKNRDYNIAFTSTFDFPYILKIKAKPGWSTYEQIYDDKLVLDQELLKYVCTGQNNIRLFKFNYHYSVVNVATKVFNFAIQAIQNAQNMENISFDISLKDICNVDDKDTTNKNIITLIIHKYLETSPRKDGFFYSNLELINYVLDNYENHFHTVFKGHTQKENKELVLTSARKRYYNEMIREWDEEE